VTLNYQLIQEEFSAGQTILGLLEPTWQSPAGLTYSAAQQAITSGAGQLVEALGQIVAAMNTSMANFQQADQTNSNNLS
jgi:uncharacterized protein YukE